MSKNRIKILYVTSYSDYNLGGQQSLVSLVENLDQDQFQPYAIVPQEGALSKKLTELGCTVLFLKIYSIKPKYYTKLIASFFAFRKIITKENIDIIHADNEHDAFIYGLFRKGLNVKLLWHMRVATPYKYDPKIEKMADSIIGVSSSLSNRLSPDIKKSKYETIYDGLDCTKFIPPSSKIIAKQNLNLDADKTIVSFIGQIKYHKGIYELIDAIEILSKKFSSADLTFVIIGSYINDKTKIEIKHLIERKHLDQYLLFPGQQNKIEQWMQASDIVILPSHSEGLGRVLVESMACKTPVIGTDIPAIKEVIAHKCGLIATLKSPESIAKHIETLASDEALRMEYGENGRKRAVEVFDIKVHAHNIEKHYKQLMYKEL